MTTSDDWMLLWQAEDGGQPFPALEALAARWAAARKRWPQVDLSLELFSSYVLTRLGEAMPTAEELARLRAEELYLACGCAYGDPNALAALERDIMPAVDRRVARILDDVTAAEDLCQELRRKLFVGDEGRPPRITSYSGQGELSNWLKVVAAREALFEKRRREPSVVEEDVLEQVAPASDFELDYLRSRYIEGFRLAFLQAFEALDAEDRVLLRYHLVDRINIDQIAAILGTHRATAARRLQRVRQHLASTTKTRLMQQLAVAGTDAESIMRLVRSALDVSIHRLLVEDASAKPDER